MVTQFLGASNDNIFKVILTLLVVGALMKEQEGGITHLILINVFFVVPFILFSPFAGALSDRYSKTSIIRSMKVMEVGVMLLATWCIASGHTYALLGVLFLTGLQSAIFSPAKYGILPELLSSEELSRGNGFIQFWTFLAIIGGTALGGFLTAGLDTSPYLPGIILVSISLCGLIASGFVGRVPAANPKGKLRYNPLDAIKTLREMKKDKGLFLSMLAISYFWAVGSLYQLNLALYAKQLGGWNDVETSMLMAALGLGIGLGSLVAGAVSEGKVELGLVPLGAFGLAVFGSTLAFTSSAYMLSIVLLVLLGLSAGFFIVPVNSYLQEHSPDERRGDYIAATNFASFSAMLFSSFLLLVLVDYLSFSPAHVFLAVGVTAILAAVYICTVLPEVLVRCINWVLVHTIYRVKVLGRAKVPAEGGALLVCNHVSYIDAPVLLASLERPVRFLMFRPIYEQKLVKPFARIMGAIPVESGSKRGDIENALAAASESIEKGELVCIFAEGGISRIGQLLQFKRGLERIMNKVDAPIVPVHLDRVWGSIFSFRGGKYIWKWPASIPYPLTVSFGDLLPSTSSSFEVRQAVQELSSEAFHCRDDAFKVLHAGFLATCKRNPFRRLVKDYGGKWVTAFGLLLRSIALARVFRAKFANEKIVGVWLPPSTAGVVTNIALLLAGKTPVPFNYTSSEDSLSSAASQCGIKKVVTATKFLEKRPFPKLVPSVETLPLEDLAEESSKTIAFVLSCLAIALPQRLFFAITPFSYSKHSDLATVIFSSGSTGTPKGVKLSHGNISSNLTALYEIQDFSKEDCMIGVLPFFHSFGFTGTLWLPLLAGMRVVYYPNPLDATAIGRICREESATVLISTPTFLQMYARKIKPEQLASLKHVFVGAERLRDSIRESFQERFGVEPREGYGATELSPVAIANVENSGEGRRSQAGTKYGSVGRPLPGVAVKIIDSNSGVSLGPDEEGLLLVKGPNVMAGYLGNDQLTKEVLQNGWYITGDMAKIDKEGFVEITGRLSRFSKIAGEMVPHGAVEEAVYDVLGSEDSVLAVTAVPDQKKGERLVVLSTLEIEPGSIVRELKETSLPNLWIPRSEDFYLVESLPMLGSGKLDLKKLQSLALEVTS